MATYRIYTVNSLGNFIGSRDIECESDAEAIEAAGRLSDGADLEIWTGERRVAIVPKTPLPRPAD